MTPEQLAQQALRVQQIQTWITGLAIVLGPLVGVLTSLWFQNRKERNDAKRQLFLALMSERKRPFVSHQQAHRLNTIDVVFSTNDAVRKLWHEYYELLNLASSEARGHKWLELLTAMATDLGYANLTQVELDKYYFPQSYFDEVELDQKLRTQLARVLSATERFVVIKRDADDQPETE